LGNTIHLTGEQAYIQLNSRLIDSGAARSDDAPTADAPTSLLTLSAARTTATTATLTYTATPLAAGQKLQIWMTIPSAGDVNPNQKQAILVGYSAAAQASAYVATLPKTWQVGQTVSFYVSVMNVSGEVSPALKSKVKA
jgi:hypothetical protein